MSTKRRVSAVFRGRGPGGRVICSCGCGREVQPPRRSWFSNACVHEWKIRNDPGYARHHVFQRDRGICCRCGADTEALRASARPNGCPIQMPEPYWIAFELGLESPYRTDGYSCWQLVPEVEAAIEQWMFVNRDVQVEWHAAAEDRQRELRALGWPHDISRSWWEADHIKPVVEGGGQCGLENLRTLCVPCHKRATAELAARRAQERKRAKQPELQLQP